MNSQQCRDMIAATKLTQAGDLARATALLQRQLHDAKAPAIALPASATEPSAPDARATNHARFLQLSFTCAAGTRAYKLYVPADYAGEPRPLIVMLHGCTQSADDFAKGTRMNAMADELDYFVAYPEQSSSANASKCWNWFNTNDQQRDTGEPSIVAGITRQIMHDYAIDPERVYVAGLSAGAAAGAVLAATYPELYAALGVHSGLTRGSAHDVGSAFAAMRGSDTLPPGSDAFAVDARRHIPTIVFHGDKDTTVHPRNGDRFTTKIESENRAKDVRSGKIPGGRSYTQTIYADAIGNSIFEHWLVHGSGHAWSGGSTSGSYTDPQGPDASREMARFFLSHRRSG